MTRWQVFWGFKSQTSSGTSTRESICFWWHSSSPSSYWQPRPQISTGTFWQAVSPTNFPVDFSTYWKTRVMLGSYQLSEVKKLTYLGGTVWLEDSLTLFWSLAITNFPLRPVALLYGVPHCLLSEGDLAVFLKVLTAFFLLCWTELSDVSEVAFLDILVNTLQHRLLG